MNSYSFFSWAFFYSLGHSNQLKLLIVLNFSFIILFDFRILVQKYEELVRAQRKIQSQSGDGVGSGGQPLSLQEELEMSGLGK